MKSKKIGDMHQAERYLFTSERLGFRNWLESDLEKMYEMSSDPEVMEYFPAIQTRKQTSDFIQRMQNQFKKNGFCYFAVEKLEDQAFIGFIGLAETSFQAFFTPCIDMGWRLHKSSWYQGYATEGAKRCLDYAFEVLGLSSVMAIAPEINLKSQRVMEKAGMKKVLSFKYPLLKDDSRLEDCVLYEIQRP